MCDTVRMPLPPAEWRAPKSWGRELKPHELRILRFDPSEIYDRVNVDHYQRIQPIAMAEFFPDIPGKCACGCGRDLTGRQRRWASDECNAFALDVRMIITGRIDFIANYLLIIFGDRACIECGITGIFRELKNGVAISMIHADHIVAVYNGGGGCWLANYQFLCEDCHKPKTKDDLRIFDANQLTLL